MNQGDKKPNHQFIQQKQGDTEKYSSIIGVRDQEETENPSRVKLREEMRAKVGANSMKKEEEELDLASALSNPEWKAVRYGVVGAGHGGSRLAEQFHQFGYKVCVANTSKQDLYHIKLPQENKLLLNYALGGAGKDPTIGQAAFEEGEPELKEMFDRVFGEDAKEVDSFIICAMLGGGSGNGGIIPLITILSDYGLPITVLCTLPLSSEGTVTKSNSINALNKLGQLSANKLINGLVIIDNSKIEEIYSNVSLGGFFKAANFDIVNIFNTFNTLSSLPTEYVAIDPMDYSKVIMSGGCTIYGKVEIPLHIEDGVVEMDEDDVADLLLQNLQQGLLVEGFDVGQALRFGVYITGKSEHLNQIPANTFNYAFASLSEELKKADMFKGVYADPRLEDKLVIYLLVSGLGLPRDRVEQLMEEAQADVEEMEEKENSMRSKMEMFQQTSNREQDRYKQKRKENTALGKMINKRRSRN